MPLSVVPPEDASELVPFQPELVNSAVQGHLESAVKGHIKQCGKEVLLSFGSLLRGYDTQTGCVYSEFQLGRQERPLVGPFVELVRQQSVHLVVAVSGGSGGPLLCVCQPVSGRVVRAIRLAAPVTHMCLVSAQRLGALGGGCVALATEDRRLLLVDLCLDSPRHYSDELRPASLVPLDGVFTDELPGTALVHGAPLHCFVHLCELDQLAEVDEMAVGNGDTEVACLQWLPQLDCLGIGLADGTVHLWDVHRASSVLVTNLPSDLPVVSLALQEPENDPRCCCYLWTAQAPAGTPLNSFAVASMHALTFQKKEPCEDGIRRYKGLVSCRQMFEYSLEPNVVPGMEDIVRRCPQEGELLASRIVSFRTLWSPSSMCTSGDGPLSPAGCARPGSEHVEDLLAISWQLVRGSHVLGTYLSLFDINQWYRAQMPRAFRTNAFQLCSFIGLFSLENPVALRGDRTVLDVRVLQSSVKRFCSPNPTIDETHFPSSLALSCVCLTTEGTVQMSFLGLQRQLLHYMNMEGPKCLSAATELYVQFSVAGLIESLRPAGSHLSQVVAQRTVLNVALEHRLIGFLVACLRGELSGEPLLPFLMEWTMATVKKIKEALNALYEPLFDCSGRDAVEIGRQMSARLEELRILHRLLELALGMPARNREVLRVWHEVTGLLVDHLSVLLFLVQAGMLPDHAIGSGLAYPKPILESLCEEARRDAGGRLLVDVLMEAALESSDIPDGDHPLRRSYPPDNLERATCIYLQRGLATWVPRAITYYLLLDVSDVIRLEYPSVTEELEDFPIMFNMGDALQSLVEGIWYLDHSRYKEGTEKLLHARSVATLSMRPLMDSLWTPVVRRLLRSGQAPLALRCLDHLQPVSTPTQISLCLDTLLANGRVVDALELVRRHSHLCSLVQLLACIVDMAKRGRAQEAHALFEELLRVPLSSAEEENLTEYFREVPDPTWLCHVTLHFLQCKRLQAAIPPSRRLRELFPEGRAQQAFRPDVCQQAFATLEVMDSFNRLMAVSPWQQNAAARRRSQSGPHVQYLGTVPTRVPHKGTTPRPVTGVSRVLAAMDPAEASPPPSLPQPHARLNEEALSILHTPPVRLWQSLTEGTPSAAQPSTSTPASILKRRAVEISPLGAGSNAMEGDPATCPTPLELDEDIPSTPDPLVRKLRFAVSDSFSSENSHDPDVTAESMETSMASQSYQQASSRDQTSSPKAADLSSDRSSQFQTASESESEESGTDLQDSPPEPVPSSSTPKHLPTSESVGTDLHAHGGEAHLSSASLAAGSPSGYKGRLPEYLIQETARRLQGPVALDTSFPGSPRPADEAAPPQLSGTTPATAAMPSSPAKSEKTTDEDDLDGTPLADEDEVELRSEDAVHLPQVSTELREGPAALVKERAAPQTPGGFSAETPISTGPVEGTPLQDDDGTELAEDASQLCSEETSASLPPTPTLSAAESGVSWPPSDRPTMSLQLPAFATSRGHTASEEARAAEEVVTISSSEASEDEQEENDEIFMVSDVSSDMLPEVLPTRVESPEGSWSRGSVKTTSEEGEVVLTELTSVPSAQLTEPLEMPREPSVGLATAALDAEEIQVEQSLPGYAVCPYEEERSLPKPDHLETPDTPATPAQPESRAVGESYGFVPAVESPPSVRSRHSSGAALPEEGALSPGADKVSFSVTPIKQPLSQAAVSNDAEVGVEFPERPLSPVETSERSPSNGGQHETGRSSIAEGTQTPADKGTSKIVVTSAYNLREKRRATWREEENREAMAILSRSRRKSGPVTPSKRSPAVHSRSRLGQDSDTSPEIAVAPKRKTRAASEEPSTPHSRKKIKALAGSHGRAQKKASSVSPQHMAQSSEEMRTTSPEAKRTTKAATAAAGGTSKKLVMPRPSRTSAASSSKRAEASHSVEEQDEYPGPARQLSASPARTPRRVTRKSVSPSPTMQKAAQRAGQKAGTGSPKQGKPAVQGLQEKVSEASTPLKTSLRTRGRIESDTPREREKTPKKIVTSTRASSIRQKRAATLSPPGWTARTRRSPQGSPVRTPEKAKTSPMRASGQKTRLRRRSSSADAARASSPVPGPSKLETPSKRTSQRVPRTQRHSSSEDIAEEPVPTRRSLRLTPIKQLATEERETGLPKLSRTPRRILETISEADTPPTERDAETSPTAPSMRKGRRSPLTQPSLSAPPKKLLLATRRSRRISVNAALETIAEAPEAEKEQEPEPTTSSRQKGGRSKRKAETELDAEGFKLAKPTEVAHKGSKSTPPKDEFVFSPPLTRHRQQQKSQASQKPTDVEPAPSTSKEENPKKQRRLPRPLAGSGGGASR